MNRAERTVSFTKEKVYSCETIIENKEREIDELEKSYSKSEDEHDLLQRQVQELEMKKEELERKKKKCSELSTKLKQNYSIVGVIFARSEVLKFQTKFSSNSLENLLGTLKEIAEIISTSAESKREVPTFFSREIDYTVFSQNLKTLQENDKDDMPLFKLVDELS